MTDDTLAYHAIAIGGGPSGLFAALAMARAGCRVVLLDRGSGMVDSLCPKVRAELAHRSIRDAERFREQCVQCTCLDGIGGAAFHFDTVVGYVDRLSRSKVEVSDTGEIRPFSALERAVGSFDRAQALIHQVYEILSGFGLQTQRTRASDGTLADRAADVFTHVDVGSSLPITTTVAVQLIGAIVKELVRLGTTIALSTEVTSIEPGSRTRWRVSTSGPEGSNVYEADAVIIAVGKTALPWVQRVLRDLDVAHRAARTVDLGVRIETERADVCTLVDRCQNPKLTFVNERAEPVRTFCVCDGGRLMQYRLADVTILDGQHCLERPTSRTNFGVLTSVRPASQIDGTLYALEYARRVNRAADGRALVQPVGQLLGWSDEPSHLRSSLADVVTGNLRACLAEDIVADIAAMIGRLNQVIPGAVRPHALVVAPAIERIYPAIELTPDLESSQRGLFFVGDCSSKVIGITYGAATGLAAAAAAVGARTRAFGASS